MPARRPRHYAFLVLLLLGTPGGRAALAEDTANPAPATSATGQGAGHLESAAAERVRQLQQALDEIVARTPLRSARAGVVVASLESGQVLYAHEPDLLLNPASNVKLFTSAAALARLGPEYRFDTEIWTDAAPAGGGAVRALYVRGKGDPSFVTERLWALAGDIVHRGVRSVRGDLVIDESWFDGERVGPGYDQEEGDRSYLAPTGAVSLNFNSVAIHVSPGTRAGEKGRVELEPPSDYVEIENRTRTVKGSARRRVLASSALVKGRQRIRVEGRLPLGSRDQVFYRKVDDPPVYFGATLKRLLELRGVKVSGQVRVGIVPPSARLLFVAQSDGLGEIVRKLDKSSNNFMAEQLLKALGAEKRGPPGTWPKGVEAVEEFLTEVGIPHGSYVMTNGSGLNDANRFTARQVVVLLRAMWQRFPVMAEFLSSLPVAGKDGTTRWRMETTEGRLRAKTGTLQHVSSLSGYVETAAHERLAFAILVNDAPGRRHLAVRGIDAVATALAASGGAPGALGAAVASASPPVPGPQEPAADVQAHLATYYQLGRAADARNVTLLRTSLKSERDPVLRMAAAEAVYLSDPDSGAARRVFLDAVASEAAQFPRLRSLATETSPVPVVGSLADLAAQGDDEAMQRLVEIGPAAMSDPLFVDRFADLWEDVTRNAPEDLLPALAAAPAAAVDATVAAVARGIVRASEPDHPLRDLLREEASGATQPDLARSIAQRLDEAIAANRAVLQTPAQRIGPAPAQGEPPGDGSAGARSR